MLLKLLSNLYSALNRDPQPQPVITVAFTPIQNVIPASYWLEVKEGVLYGTNGVGQNADQTVNPLGTPLLHPNIAIPLRGLNLTGLVNALNSTQGFSVSLNPDVNGSLSALMLVEGVQDIVAYDQLSIATSLLWAILRPIADSMAIARTDTMEGLKQVSPQYSSGIWLSSLGDLYGVDREVDEDDQTYQLRVLYTVLKPRANNKAMADYLKYALQLQNVDVTDDDVSMHTGIAPDVALPYRFFVDLQPNIQGGLPIQPQSIYNIVQAIKAWGTIWSLRIIDTYSETYTSTAVDENAVWQFIGQPEDASSFGKTDIGAAKVTVQSFDYVGVQLGLFQASVWMTNNTTNIPDTPGYDPSIGTTVASQLSDPSIVMSTHGNTAFSSVVTNITELWHDINSPYTGTDSYSTTSKVTESVVWKMLVSDTFNTTSLVSDVDSSSLHDVKSDQVPMRPRPFMCSVMDSQAGTLNTFLSDNPQGATTTPYTQTLGEISLFAVTRGGSTVWYTDANHPASP